MRIQEANRMRIRNTYLHPFLFRLAEPVQLSDSVQPIKMAAAGEEFYGECLETGWSLLSGNNNKSTDTFITFVLKHLY
jgi:hypothetical protein